MAGSKRVALRRLVSLRPVRFLAGSGVSFVVGVGTLDLGFALWRWPAPVASTVSYILAAMVAYGLHRRWAFERRGWSSLSREVLPYGVMFAVSLALANLAAQGAAELSAHWTESRGLQGLVVLGAVIVANVVSVPLRYMVCRWIFTDFALRGRDNPPSPPRRFARGASHAP